MGKLGVMKIKTDLILEDIKKISLPHHQCGKAPLLSYEHKSLPLQDVAQWLHTALCPTQARGGLSAGVPTLVCCDLRGGAQPQRYLSEGLRGLICHQG